MTDGEFAAWLRSLPRELSPEDVDRLGHEHDVEQGDWINPHESVHHWEESRH